MCQQIIKDKKMDDFATVRWDSDAATDEIIQRLFQPVLTTRKKKHRPKPSKSGRNAVPQKQIAVCQKLNDREKHSRRKKLRANVGHNNRLLGSGTEGFEDNVTHLEEDKTQAAEDGNHVSRKIHKKKCCTLAMTQQNVKSGVGSGKKRTKMRLNKQLEKKIKSECATLCKAVSCDNDLWKNDCLTEEDSELIPAHEESGSQSYEGCSLKRNVHHKTNGRLNISEDTNRTENVATRKRKHKMSVEDGVLQGAKKLKHQKIMKKSVFNVPKLREVLSVERPANQTSEAVLPLEETNQQKTNKTNKEQRSLKDRMQQQLKSSRFRYLNEQLYSGSGTSAYEMFKNDQDLFRIYHEGYQKQVSKWPSHPLDTVIQYVRKSRSSHVVADFGCGDAHLAESVPQKVHSFDLVALKPCVTACDMAHVPLKSCSIDICVFCLSLMGTNLLDYLLEAHRVLKMEGILLIAEVTSRFESISLFIRKLEKLGFILIKKDNTSKMFVFFEFKKKADYDKALLPQITLEPCVYKKR